MILAPEIIHRYQHDGAICLRQVFDKQTLAALSEGISTCVREPSRYSEALSIDGKTHFFNDYCNWQHIDEFKAFIFDSPAKHIVKALMQSKRLNFYHEHVLIKEPGNQCKTPWHHDQPYYPVDGDQICSIWLPIDPVPFASSLQFVKGSHRWGKLFMPRKFATSKNYEVQKQGRLSYESVPDIDRIIAKQDILSWAILPGDCVIFHGKTLHAAQGNSQTQTSRRVFSTRWLGDDTRFCLRPWQISPPITGNLTAGDAFHSELFPEMIF